MSVIVNTDYESVLFDQKPSLKMVRELEFLGLWLNDKVKNVQQYSESYLDKVEELTGRRPLLTPQEKAEYWWGSLSDIPRERILNSKETSFYLARELGEDYGRILEKEEDLRLLNKDVKYLFKSFGGVSGKGHKFINQIKAEDFPLMAEVFHQRKLDFSTYCYSDHNIFYQNFISEQFGYKGSLFDLQEASQLLHLSFCHDFPQLNWEEYLHKVEKIIQYVRLQGNGGFSIDSYIFDQRIRALCEINYRRTMGVTAYEIAQAVSQDRFALFLILKSKEEYQSLERIVKSLDSILLNHDRTIFSYLLITGDSLIGIQDKLKKLESILGASFSIKLQ